VSLLNLRDLDFAGLEHALAHHALSSRALRKIFSHVHAKQRTSLDDLALLTSETRRILAATTHYPDVTILDRRRASDGFVKYLYELPDGAKVEAVRIPLPDPAQARALKEKRRRGEVVGLSALPTAKYTVCISSQVGCALGCVFCATGRMGFSRNLATWEMLAQIRHIQREADHPISGVLFLGMGEPLLNYESVLATARVLSHPAGFAISAEAISISTVGIVPAILRFTKERQPFRLIISLASAESPLRASLLPIEKRYPLHELRQALIGYAQAGKGRITLAYVAISGVNMSPQHAQCLVEWTQGMRVKVNLIDVNDDLCLYHPPTEEEVAGFREVLFRAHIPLVRRYAGGREIGAACGTLAGTASGGTPHSLP
jgi:23S rRNA (adenine2503-C2)-methyltransferase